MPKNVFPYPGNKARHADWIIENIPEHDCYVEPFGGAAGVLFNKPRSKIEVYNDLNGDIPHFFEVLRDRCDELQEWLRNVPYSRTLHEKWSESYFGGDRPDDDIERAGRFFVLRYTQFGGSIDSSRGFASCCGTRNNARRLPNKVESLHEFRDRLRDVEIESSDAFDVVDRHDSPDTVFYTDPPYQGTEGCYNSDGFDHRKLAKIAKGIDGRMIISYDSVPHFYGDGFTVVSKDSTFSGGNVGGHKEATENLIMNFDSDGEPLMSDVGQSSMEQFVG